jgi:RHH-type transcriptional regulator, rel operon repressor / antitoxin RelB
MVDVADPTTLTVHLAHDVRSKLNEIAVELHSAEDTLAAEAIAAYVEAYTWQIAEITSALGEAERGDYASDSDVAGVFAKWTR